MLDQLRQGAQGWVSKLLMALLVLSFAIWGIGGFQGYHTGTLATVGNEEVSVQEFARLYANAQRSAQRSGQQVNPAAGALRRHHECRHRRCGERLRPRRLRRPRRRRDRQESDLPALRRHFRPRALHDLLANADINRDDFIHDVKQQLVRGQIANSLGAGLERAAADRRGALPAAERGARNLLLRRRREAIRPVGEPGDTDLQAYFDDNKDNFRAPEYRKLAPPDA